MKIKPIAIALFAIVALSMPAFGGPDGPSPNDGPTTGPQEDRHRDGPGGMGDDELREMVSTIMMVRISRNLELTDEQTVILVKHMQEMRDEFSKIYVERDTIMKSLRELVSKEGATDDEINAKLDELISVEEKRAQARRNAYERTASGLTAKQKAKLYLTTQEFEGQMRKMMQRAKEMGDESVREKLQEWGRDGAGPPHGPMDRPMMKQHMMNRRPGPPLAQDGAAPPPPVPDAKPN